MANHGLCNSDFKGSMAESGQEIWNDVCFIYERFLWWIVSVHVFFIGLCSWIDIPKDLLEVICKFKIRCCANNTKMLKMLKNVRSTFWLVKRCGYHWVLQRKKKFESWMIGWDFGIFDIGNGVVLTNGMMFIFFLFIYLFINLIYIFVILRISYFWMSIFYVGIHSCNLSETIHNKWLQQSSNKGSYFYVVTMDDYVCVIWQSTNYYAYLKGYTSETGLDKDEVEGNKAFWWSTEICRGC